MGRPRVPLKSQQISAPWSRRFLILGLHPGHPFLLASAGTSQPCCPGAGPASHLGLRVSTTFPYYPRTDVAFLTVCPPIVPFLTTSNISTRPIVDLRRLATRVSESIESILESLSPKADPRSRELESSLASPSTALVAATILIIVLATWAASGIDYSAGIPPSSNYSPALRMASLSPRPGHVGNLTASEEEKLRKLWIAILEICGVADGTNGSSQEATPTSPAISESGVPKKRRFGLFRWRGNEDQPASPKTGAEKDRLHGEDDDKFGQLKQFHHAVANQSPESLRQVIWAMVKHDHPDALLLRFLRARKWDVDKALVMLVATMNWRHSDVKVDDIMKHGEAGAVADEINGQGDERKLGVEFMSQLRMGKSFLHGTDKEGRPISVVRVRLHKPGDQSSQSLERYTVYNIETTRLLLEAPVDTATIIFDMTGFSLANMDYQPIKFMIQCFEANYPESLGAVLVHNAPWMFQGIWKIIRGWLDPVVAAKVHFTNNKSGLEEFIVPERIIKELEGSEDWEYKYEEPVPGENDLMKDTDARDRLLQTRERFVKEFEDATKSWVRTSEGEEQQKAGTRRDELASQLRENYWQLDPYVRARSLYDRQGVIQQGGAIDWYSKNEKELRT